MDSQCLSRLGYRELARGVLSKPSGIISLAARDSVPKAVLRSSSSSRSKSITSIAIGWFEEERSHNHGQESKNGRKRSIPALIYTVLGIASCLVGQQAGGGDSPCGPFG